MNNNLLKIKELTKSFNKNSVLKKINMNVKKGEVIALIGSSGSGKYTLMNLITRTLEIEKGNILLDGKEISQYNNKIFAKKVGMLRQQFDLVENIKVVNNVLVGRFNEWGFFKSFISL